MLTACGRQIVGLYAHCLWEANSRTICSPYACRRHIIGPYARGQRWCAIYLMGGRRGKHECRFLKADLWVSILNIACDWMIFVHGIYGCDYEYTFFFEPEPVR